MLEHRLGLRLLVRTTAGVALTPAGRQVFDEAQTLLKSTDEALSHLFQQVGADQKELLIGSIFGFHSALVLDCNEAIPGYNLKPVSLDFLDPAAAVIDGSIDIGIVLGPTHFDSALDRYNIATEARIALTQHPLTKTSELVELAATDHLEWPEFPKNCDQVNLGHWRCDDIRGSSLYLTSPVHFELFALRSWLLQGSRVATTIASVVKAFTLEGLLVATPLAVPPWPLNLVVRRDTPVPAYEIADCLRRQCSKKG